MGDDEGLSISRDSSDEEAVSIWQPLIPATCDVPEAEARPAARCGHVPKSTRGSHQEVVRTIGVELAVAVSYGNGKRLLIIGGYNAEGILSLRDVWEFAFETRTWFRLHLVDGPTPPERAYFRGCDGPPVGTDGREEKDPFVYVNGGLDAGGDPSNDVWCLDVENRTWSEVHRGGIFPPSRFNQAMCRMGCSLAVHGGESSSGSLLDDFCLFHPSTASWSETRISSAGPRPCARSSHCLCYAERTAEGSSTPASLVLFGGLGRDPEGLEEADTMPLNDLWVLSPVTNGGLWSAQGMDACDDYSLTPPVWSLVLFEGVGPSPRSLAVLSPRPCGRELFLFGGYGLVELPATGDANNDGGDIMMAYIDDLWMLSLDRGVALNPEWVDEEGMGFAGESIVEGRNGHTLTWCGDKLVLFGGFVGDGFDSSLHVAEVSLPPENV